LDKQSAFERIKALKFDKEEVFYSEHGLDVSVLRPSELSARFKNYDVEKNFQIWLTEGHRKFRPNHLRVFIDLNLRIRSEPKMKRELLTAFDNIFYGKDPESELVDLAKVNFDQFLNPIITIGVMSQLFIIEQEYAYNKESKFDPPTLFYQGWIREVIDAPKEIDNMCMSIANGQPPAAQYVKLENKKDKSFHKDLMPLWYFHEDAGLSEFLSE
jgi:hypothetical protein